MLEIGNYKATAAIYVNDSGSDHQKISRGEDKSMKGYLVRGLGPPTLA